MNLNILDTKEQVLAGLWSKDMFHAMSSRSHASIDDLLHDMLEHMVNQRLDRARTHPGNAAAKYESYAKDSWRSRYTPETKTIAAKTSAQTMETLRPSTSNGAGGTLRMQPAATANSTERGSIKCCNCQAHGHLSRDCPLPCQELYCVRCKLPGHFVKNCSQGRAKVKTIQDLSSCSVNKYLKLALIKDVEFRFFIDMGSAACLMTASTALHNRFPSTYQDLSLQPYEWIMLRYKT